MCITCMLKVAFLTAFKHWNEKKLNVTKRSWKDIFLLHLGRSCSWRILVLLEQTDLWFMAAVVLRSYVTYLSYHLKKTCKNAYQMHIHWDHSSFSPYFVFHDCCWWTEIFLLERPTLGTVGPNWEHFLLGPRFTAKVCRTLVIKFIIAFISLW